MYHESHEQYKIIGSVLSHIPIKDRKMLNSGRGSFLWNTTERGSPNPHFFIQYTLVYVPNHLRNKLVFISLEFVFKVKEETYLWKGVYVDININPSGGPDCPSVYSTAERADNDLGLTYDDDDSKLNVRSSMKRARHHKMSFLMTVFHLSDRTDLNADCY